MLGMAAYGLEMPLRDIEKDLLCALNWIADSDDQEGKDLIVEPLLAKHFLGKDNVPSERDTLGWLIDALKRWHVSTPGISTLIEEAELRINSLHNDKTVATEGVAESPAEAA